MRRLGDLDLNRVHVGNCLDLLRLLPDECVHCAVTSPPYLGLRAYGIPPTAWGGDGSCVHEWDASSGYVGHRSGKGPQVSQTKNPSNDGYPAPSTPVVSGACTRCGAWLGCLGLEPTPAMYVAHLVEVFREVRRVLRSDGTAWLNLGDSYASTSTYNAPRSMHSDGEWRQPGRGPNAGLPPGLKPKDLIGIPWMAAFALRDDGWWLRSDICWAKPAPMPESVEDRCTRAHEYVFHLAKAGRYFYDKDAILEPFADERNGRDGGRIGRVREAHRISENVGKPSGIDPSANGGRNKRDVWTVAAEPFADDKGQHFAVMPSGLVKPCVLAGTSERGACPACGAPWSRMAIRSRTPDRASRVQGRDGDSINEAHGRDGRSGSRFRTGVVTEGWEPSCSCGRTDSVPCVVLDPFAGTGTVGKVAQDLGRDWIGMDLNESFSEMAARRTSQAGLLAWRP